MLEHLRVMAVRQAHRGCCALWGSLTAARQPPAATATGSGPSAQTDLRPCVAVGAHMQREVADNTWCACLPVSDGGVGRCRSEIPRSCFSHNAHERQILVDYLTATGMSFTALLSEIAGKVREGTFQLACAPATSMVGSMRTFPWATAAPSPAVAADSAPSASSVAEELLSGEVAAAAHSCAACWQRLLPPLIYQC
eukprot:COSAG01_NODE_14542_length_1440_cov_1.225951_1_plen_195_part_10